MPNPITIISRIATCLCELPKFFRPTKQPRLVMTLLVKNEADVLERNLQFHHAMGVDAFIVTDNNSTDATPAILQKYKAKGWIVRIIEEKADGYEQKRWVDRMVMMAKNDYKADWIINADADEFWYAPSGSLKNEMAQTPANVLRCTSHSVYPDEAQPFWQWTHLVKGLKDVSPYDLPPHSIFAWQRGKVAHRAAGYLHIAMGNHKVAMLPRRIATTSIRIYHFNIRGRQQFIEKMKNGGEQLEKHHGKHGGAHWRYFYTFYKEGRLEQAYDSVIGLPVQQRLLADGIIYEDHTLADFFKTLPQQ